LATLISRRSMSGKCGSRVLGFEYLVNEFRTLPLLEKKREQTGVLSEDQMVLQRV
jgi:hypothetical protein